MNFSAAKPIDESTLSILAYNQQECVTLADFSYWIPFQSHSTLTQFEVEELKVADNEFSGIELNAVPTIFNLKLTLLRVLLRANSIDALKLVANLWRCHDLMSRKSCLLRMAELLYFTKNSLSDIPNREQVSESVFEIKYHQLISKIDLLCELLLHEINSTSSCFNAIPKWKGKSMQFIELISIGIELDLFEGSNQNQICNSLLKAFQVDAESDQPIYKQRFNALFKRSKIHLPLICDFITKVEEAKKMKIIFAADDLSV